MELHDRPEPDVAETSETPEQSGNARNELPPPDVFYSRDRENIRRLVAALKPFHPYLRGAPPGLPFVLDERTVRNGLNFTLDTDLGKLDLLGEVPAGRDYQELLPHSQAMEANGI